MNHPAIALISFLTSILSFPAQDNTISGIYLGQHVQTTVGHPLAAYYYNKLVNGMHHKEKMEAKLSRAFNTIPKSSTLDKNIAFFTRHISVDFATLYFIYQTYNSPINRGAQDLFQHSLHNIYHLRASDIIAREYLYVFVPGLFYRRHPETGGDFAAQRSLPEGMGLSTKLIEINEVGSLEDNAHFIRDEITRLSQKYDKIILVSASKGGTDVTYALGKLMSKEDSESIRAWISIGGVLRGSKIADNFLNGLKRVYANIVLSFIGAKREFVDVLSVKKSIARYNSLHFPEDLLIIHYVGAPLSGHISPEVRKNYKMLSEDGPNDGLTLLMDEITSKGVVINEIGLDHYYKDPNIDK